MNGFEATGMLVFIIASFVGGVYWHTYVIDKWFKNNYSYKFTLVIEIILEGLLYLFPIVIVGAVFCLLLGENLFRAFF